MNKVFFIADTHFSDKNIINYENRPFQNISEMDYNMPYANLFGHIHNSPLFKDYSNHHFCVSAERINYTPISLEEIIEKVISE